MTDSIFSEVPPTPAPTPENTAKLEIVLPDSVKELVGEGKKYASVEKALEALSPAQAHIAKLESELKEMREQSGNARSTEDVLRAIEGLKNQAPATPAAAVTLDEAKLQETLGRILTEREQANLHKQNTEAVKQALVGKFKDKADEQYRKRAEELKMPLADLNRLVASSPAAAMELLGLSARPAQTGAKVQNDYNPAAFSQQPPASPPASVMRGASTQEMVAAWKRAAPVSN